ncbi:hypothetical protein [Thermococcus alcaliphilus]|uniref:hypothetical protein n=1 Tax=Thermococcus alcaliphilus TaxID=139207 RepID=UPI00209142C5|nr:hypothetical protein [Thermococcus alcaliphilus]MCO6040335.1 hypothetical protein [Thermococcus alcaliphilus]
MEQAIQKLIRLVGVSLFILAALYLGELLFNLDNPHFNDADTIELIVKSAMFFLLLGGALIIFSVFYPEGSKMIKTLGTTGLLALIALLEYGLSVENFTKCSSSCGTFEMHWSVNVLGLVTFVLSISSIVLAWVQFLKSEI